MSTHKRYRIALPGTSAYAETNSARKAITLLHEARQVQGERVRVYDTIAGVQISEYDLNTGRPTQR